MKTNGWGRRTVRRSDRDRLAPLLSYYPPKIPDILFIVITQQVGFYYTSWGGGMNKQDFVIAHMCDHAAMKPLRSLFLKLEINQISRADSFPSTLLPNFRLFFRRSGELYTNGFISVVDQSGTVDTWFGIASPFVGCSNVWSAGSNNGRDVLLAFFLLPLGRGWNKNACQQECC